MDYESFRPLDGAHDRLSTLILAASLALALGFIGCGHNRMAQPEGDELPAPKRALVLVPQDDIVTKPQYPAELMPIIERARAEAEKRGCSWTYMRIEWAQDLDTLSKLPGCPKRDGCTVVSFYNPTTNTVYLCRSRAQEIPADLAHELGHAWLGYGSSPEDERKCDAFAEDVLKAADEFVNRKGVIFVLREGGK